MLLEAILVHLSSILEQRRAGAWTRPPIATLGTHGSLVLHFETLLAARVPHVDAFLDDLLSFFDFVLHALVNRLEVEAIGGRLQRHLLDLEGARARHRIVLHLPLLGNRQQVLAAASEREKLLSQLLLHG